MQITQVGGGQRTAKDPGLWWEDSDTESNRAFAAAKALVDDSLTREQFNLVHSRLYCNLDLQDFSSRAYGPDHTYNLNIGNTRVAFNVVRTCIEALTSKIGKLKPRPTFQTFAGSFVMQQKAKRLNKFMQGVFYEGKFYKHLKEVFRDACVFGTGFLRTYLRKGRVCYERIFPNDVFVDDADGRYGCPRQMVLRVPYPREVLKRKFPKAKELLETAKGSENAYQQGFGDVVDVYELWHLPSDDGAKDGKHAIAIAEGTLKIEAYELDSFPIKAFRYNPRPLGFYGQGVSEILTGIQVEMNRLTNSVSMQLRRKGRGQWLVPQTANVPDSHLRNAIGDIIRYSGNVPPQVVAQNAIAPEEFMQIDRLYQKAFQEVGVSELSVAAKKPSGLDAAVALREFEDIESDRFADLTQRLEEFVMECTEYTVDVVAANSGDGYNVRLPNRRKAIEIDWKDIDLSKDAYTLQVFPSSSLPLTPGARYARVKEMQADGFIDQTVARRLLDFPDIDAEEQLGTAAIDDVDATISAILDDPTPKYMPPEEMQNLELLLQRAQAAHLRVRHTDIEADRLTMLEQLINATGALLDESDAATPPPPGLPALPPEEGAMPPMPGAMPGAPMQPQMGIPPAVPPAV